MRYNFKRITTTLDDEAKARLCESSGSEHSASAADSVTDLSGLVDSFFDGEYDTDHPGERENEAGDDREETECDNKVDSFYGKEMLMDLIHGDEDEDEVSVIRLEVDAVCRSFENTSEEGFKRKLMSVLRQKGFDAGLCKSRWEKTGRHPAGEYEYIDVLTSNNRYIVEPSFPSEFTIARPTKTYQSLLETIPKITVIKPNNLKKLVRIMCAAMRDSLKTKNMLVSPWRKNGYMQSKWNGPYKRTINPLPLRSKDAMANRHDEFNGESLLGFECLPVTDDGSNKYYCRKEVGKMHVVGNLKTLMLSGMS